jgi:hypothetical protein
MACQKLRDVNFKISETQLIGLEIVQCLRYIAIIDPFVGRGGTQ